MAEKVTKMVLTVDLQCSRCYKKIKKILCKFPQIRDQVYDEKQNMVTITVQSCSPEKIRDKLCCKAGKTIKRIEIKELEKTKPAIEGNKKRETEKPNETDKPKPKDKTRDSEPAARKTPVPVPVPGFIPIGVCRGPCYEGGHTGGPCLGRPPPGPPPCSCGCGRSTAPCHDDCTGGPCLARPPPGPPPCSCGCGRSTALCHDGYYRRPCYSRCDFYFPEENPSACAIM